MTIANEKVPFRGFYGSTGVASEWLTAPSFENFRARKFGWRPDEGVLHVVSLSSLRDRQLAAWAPFSCIWPPPPRGAVPFWALLRVPSWPPLPTRGCARCWFPCCLREWAHTCTRARARRRRHTRGALAAPLRATVEATTKHRVVGCGGTHPRGVVNFAIAAPRAWTSRIVSATSAQAHGSRALGVSSVYKEARRLHKNSEQLVRATALLQGGRKYRTLSTYQRALLPRGWQIQHSLGG